MVPLLSRELARRVGLAGRILGMDTRTLLPILIDAIGLPFTKSRFAKLTVRDLRLGISRKNSIGSPPQQADNPELDQLKHAVRCLWGFKEGEEQDLPDPAGCHGAPLPGGVRVAVATSNGKLVDEHFNGALRFFVYEVSKDALQLIDIRSASEAVDAVDTIEFRAQLIPDCEVLFTQAIGGHVAAKVIQRGIYPLTVEHQPPVGDVLRLLQQKMQDNPPPWLGKAMNVPVDDRIRYQNQELLEQR